MVTKTLLLELRVVTITRQQELPMVLIILLQEILLVTRTQLLVINKKSYWLQGFWYIQLVTIILLQEIQVVNKTQLLEILMVRIILLQEKPKVSKTLQQDLHLVTRTQQLVNTKGINNTVVGFIYQKLVISRVLFYTTGYYNIAVGNYHWYLKHSYWKYERLSKHSNWLVFTKRSYYKAFNFYKW